MNLRDYLTSSEWNRIKDFSEDKETPFLVVDLKKVKKNYIEMKNNFETADLYYAVKASPSVEVLKVLIDQGSCFDIASIYELDRLLSLGVEPDRISYGNTIKKVKDLKYAYEKGIRLFVTDSELDLLNILEHAPGSRIFIRLLVEGSNSADWPLARKFGCSLEEVRRLITIAKDYGVDIYGISFHVGSQQRNILVWEYALLKVKEIFEWAKEYEDVELEMINMGGGFPSNYYYPAEDLEVYSENIKRFLEQFFEDKMPRIILEPGRSLAGNTGVLVSEIVLISQKNQFENFRWIYQDAGKFNGLIETLDESIKYPVYTEKKGEKGEVVLAGPTCDSMDIMYEDFKYELPMNLEIGDRLYWLSTGAYTSSYCAVEFNGFPPMKTYFIEDSSK
ncbi:MAG: type III PLP-dependent enzyme [Tissierellales bacterium]|nr:type III PLP-dependent enzyme [Tissierellales bacterium]MBN2828113.1 type III PLP-dependent enzyme [Tissierellales bacterium]